MNDISLAYNKLFNNLIESCTLTDLEFYNLIHSGVNTITPSGYRSSFIPQGNMISHHINSEYLLKGYTLKIIDSSIDLALDKYEMEVIFDSCNTYNFLFFIGPIQNPESAPRMTQKFNSCDITLPKGYIGYTITEYNKKFIVYKFK